jgi:hypothetical protein
MRLAVFFALAFLALPLSAAKPYNFLKLVDTSWILPQGSIWGFSDASLSNGEVAFGISFDVGTHYGIFARNSAGISNIVSTGDIAPVDTFKFVSAPTISGGKIAFDATYSGDAELFTGEHGIVLQKENSLIPVAETGDVGPTGKFTRVGGHSISQDSVAFAASVGGDENGIFVSKDGVVSTVVQRGDVAPVGTFSGFGTGTAISGDNVAFAGQYSGLTGAFRSNGQDIVKIVQSGDAAPVGVFGSGRSFGFPTISGESVAFAGSFGVGGQPTNNGIFVGDGGPLRVIAKTGDPAPNGVFIGFNVPSIAGEYVAFTGLYSGSIPSAQALFVADGSSLSSIIATGEPLFGSTAVLLDIGRFGLDDSGNGALVFRYNLANGLSGLAIAYPVPEPGTLVIGVTLLTCVSIAFKRRENLLLRC